MQISFVSRCTSFLKKKNRSLYFSVEVFSTAVLIGDTINIQVKVKVKLNSVKNPNWWEANQMAFYIAWSRI